jgi:NAD(P) transhydrogenase subunit alpha
VAVESGAGDAANCSDDSYRAAGAEVIEGAASLWAASDIVFKVGVPTQAEVGLLREGGTLIGFVWPAQNPELMQQLAAKKATVLAIDALPRQLSRAQKMDALTSQAGVAGYRAVIEAANAFGRFFNGQITAAGKVPPAKVFIAGAGVAGLAAIGTAAGLGAIVRANDTRAEVADQVVSLGGEFVKVDYEEEGSGGGGYAKVMSEGFQQAQREMYAKQAREVDIIITTALIPGKPAPRLITAEMVQSMKPGSVIVDMAAERGGNCELTEPGKAVVKHGVTIVGYTDLNSRLAKQSSTLYATNLFRLTEELCKTKDGVINVNMEDDAIRGLTVIKEGESPGRRRRPSCRPRRRQAGRRRAAAKKGGTATARPPNRWRPASWRSCSPSPPRCSGSSAPMPRRPSSPTSRCSCWPASSATWWCGT